MSHAQDVDGSTVLAPKQQMTTHTEALRSLMYWLYTQHPIELAKSTKVSAREFTEWVFEGKANWKFDAVRNLQGEAALALWDDPDYKSDLILPMIIGLETLLFKAYGAPNEYQIQDTVDQGKLKATSCQLQKFVKSLPKRAEQGRLVKLFAGQATLARVESTVLAINNRMKNHNAIVVKCQQ